MGGRGLLFGQCCQFRRVSLCIPAAVMAVSCAWMASLGVNWDGTRGGSNITAFGAILGVFALSTCPPPSVLGLTLTLALVGWQYQVCMYAFMHLCMCARTHTTVLDLTLTLALVRWQYLCRLSEFPLSSVLSSNIYKCWHPIPLLIVVLLLLLLLLTQPAMSVSARRALALSLGCRWQFSKVPFWLNLLHELMMALTYDKF
jgi:hypothetical protein